MPPSCGSAAVIIAVTFGKAVATYLQAVVTQRMVPERGGGAAAAPVRALTRADLAQVAREAPARQAARFTTDAGMVREMLGKVISAAADLLTVVGLVGSMIWMDWQMALLAALLYPIAAWPIVAIGKRIRRASRGMQDQVGESASLLVESFGAARVVRAYRLEPPSRRVRSRLRPAEESNSASPAPAPRRSVLEALGASRWPRAGFVGCACRAASHGRQLHRLRRRAADRSKAGCARSAT